MKIELVGGPDDGKEFTIPDDGREFFFTPVVEGTFNVFTKEDQWAPIPLKRNCYQREMGSVYRYFYIGQR